MRPEDLLEPFQYNFMQNAFIAGVLAAVACGIIGTYVVVKRLVFISGGIAHTTFGGIGLGYYFNFDPMWGAVLFALASALALGVSTLKTKVREDSTIGIMWVMGMAAGIVLIQMTEGYRPDPISVLFGNILLVEESDLWLMLGLTILIIAIVSVLYNDLLALSFDEEFAKISGVRTSSLYIMLLCLVALTVVVLIKIVGHGPGNRLWAHILNRWPPSCMGI
jgi:zinc transport system permease protein